VARQIALLTNPTAGRGKGRRTAAIAVPRLREAGFEVRELVGADAFEALELARRAVDDGVETLVVCGGDGIVHVGVQAVAGTDTNLGLIPAGSGNDVARYFSIPRADPQAAADVVVGSRVRTVDLARAGGTWFTTVLASGFDSLVNERANRMRWPRGQMRYNLATLAELRVFEPLPYTLVLDGEERRLDAMLVAVGNGPSYGGGLRVAEGASLDDGLLDVVVIRPMSKRRLVTSYPRLFAGTISAIAEYEHHHARTVTVAAPGIVAYADGERIGALPLTVESVPGALKVLVP
jgi:diacylglycerol kinase (ATP)